ncbi:MAG TPA: PEP-CTERM sorting domain-containing protein [Pirellulales bacterium]|jgi:hypothetical protein
MKRIFGLGVACLCVIFSANVAVAGTLLMNGTADGDSTYIESGSDGFIRVDLYDPGTTQQRFHSISDPSVEYGNKAYDGFPHDANWQLGSLTYDDSGLIGGTGTAPITGVALGIEADPLDPTYYNYSRWLGTTTVNSFSGTVTLLNGAVTNVSLTTTDTYSFTVSGLANYSIPGTFSITGNRFDGNFSGPTVFGGSSTYDFAGTLTTVVPEPGTFTMAGLAGIALVGLRRLRTRKRSG